MAPACDNAASTVFKLLELRRKGDSLLGARAWFLVSCYGKVTEGPDVGSYVSGLSWTVQLDLIRQLNGGATVPVHLMHRHKSGMYEKSVLRWSQGELYMVFDNREERA